MITIKHAIFVLGVITIFTSSEAYALTGRKAVEGRIILCDVWSDGTSTIHCSNPMALPNAVLKVRREGNQSEGSKVYANEKGKFSILRVPGRYVASIDSHYQLTRACDLVSFPEGDFEKTVVVGSKNKRKDLYFQERCPV